MSPHSKIHTRGQLFFSLIVLAFLAWAQLVQDLAAARVKIPAASDSRIEAWQVWERGWLQQYRPLLGPGLFTLAILLVLPVTSESAALTRENLALALSVVLLGLLMMITRRNAVTQVIGFMSLENGLILAAVGVSGMPLVVEMSVAFSVMVAFIIFGIFFFQIRERFDTLDLHYLEAFRGERS